MRVRERVLLLGGWGQLGTEIRRLLGEAQTDAPTHAQLDVTNVEAVERAMEARDARILINCAAFHNVERCETEPQTALAVNAVAVGALAELCSRRNARFLTISTDYVFDGTLGRPYREGDAPHPINAYGISKYAGELLVGRLHAAAYVVRTCGVYGVRASTAKGYTFLDRIIAQARAGERVRVVSDQIVTPTYAGHLAQAVLELLSADAAYGVYHLVNEGPVSWYDYACDALREAGLQCEVEPVSSASWNSRVRRPAYSALENTRARALGVIMPPWQHGVAAYVRAKFAAFS